MNFVLRAAALILAAAAFMCISPPADARASAPVSDDEAPQRYRMVRIFVPDGDALARVLGTGLDVEGSAGTPGGWMEFIAGPWEMESLTSAGIPFEVTDDDPAATLSAALSPVPFDALGFGTGSMGGYYTYSEVVAQLDSMRHLYPSLVTAKQAVGYTNEGRTIWGVKISDNPEDEETDEPAVLYTALIHAREPAGMMTVVYYMWWLLEEYGNDPRATYLVNNREIWFIPVVNADGYAFNELTNPSGGGFWRKNRRNNGNGSFGVDLNRNFGTDEMWNAPNGGSSTSTGSDTYRGTGPFSEPETATFNAFMRTHQIRTCLNYHTSGRLLIYPYGYLSAESEDSLIYREFAFDMVRKNRYTSGTDLQTVHYSTRGNSDDFMYGDTTKFRTFAMTPEVGSSFWPASSLILPLAQENLEANIHYSMVAGSLALPDDRGSDGATAAPLVPGESFGFPLRIRNKGLSPARSLTVSLSTDSGFLAFDPAVSGIDSIAPLGDTTIIVSGTVDPAVPAGRVFGLVVELSSPDGYIRRDTLTLYTGEPILLFADDAEAGAGLWIAEWPWTVSTYAHGGLLSFRNSPSPSSQSGLETASPVYLSGVDAARLRFWTRWEIEPSHDFGTVNISTDGGATWHSLRAGLSNPGSGSGMQPAGTWGYDGYTPGLSWVYQEIDLSAYAGHQALLRFEMAANNSTELNGWYIDDIAVEGFRRQIPGSAVHITAAVSSAPALFFGEWPGASDGIDTSLGELELPPPPGPDTFDVRWVLPGGAASLTDIRDTIGPGHSPVLFTLSARGTAGDYPLTVRWDRSLLPPGGWWIRDAATSGSVLAADMWLSDHVDLPDTGINTLELIHSPGDSSLFPVAGKWNLVSLPVDPPDRSVAANFPGSTGTAYGFALGYVPSDTLIPGVGYWIRNSSPGTASITGVPRVSTQLSNPDGDWILFGTLYCPVPRTDICTECSGPPLVYGYDNGYFIPDTLLPGKAYWYRGDGEIDFDCFGSQPAALKPDIHDPLATLDRMVISDASGVSATLYLLPPAGGDSPGAGEIGQFPSPPRPPGPLFDARFENQGILEYFTDGPGDEGRDIVLDNPSGEMTILLSRAEGSGHRYAIEVPGSAGAGTRLILAAGETLRLPPPAGGRLRLVGMESTPGVFALHRNFPNPFNPRTTIGFDLPSDAVVTLTVRSITGQEVAGAVTAGRFAAGSHTVEFDGSTLASGVYFYTLTAAETASGGVHRATGKFLLIR